MSERPTTWFEDMSLALGRVEPVIPECVQAELLRMSERRGRRGALATVAMKLSAGFERRPCGRASVDDEVISASQELAGAAATTDREMANTLKSLHVRVVGLRGGRVNVE